VKLADIWVYLAASPLLHLTLTLLAYLIGDWLYQRANMHPLLNPVFLAVVMLVTLLTVTRTTYVTYFEGAQFVHFLLGPAVVALAVPLYFNAHHLRRMWLPLMGGMIVGATTAVTAAVGTAWLLKGSKEIILSLAPKSVTAPVAMGITEKLGGLPSLTAILVVSTGIGTARAFQESERAGAFSGLAMGLNTLVTAIIIPPLMHFVKIV
jgi:putative effector of murein hydrolase